MKWYQFRQNNSGGYDTNPAKYVHIEAQDCATANGIAEDRGLYWDGVSAGTDCPCCGDRWYPCAESDATERPDTDLGKYHDYYNDSCKEDGIPLHMLIHADGTIEKFGGAV